MTMTPGGALWRCETCAGAAANVAVLRKYLCAEIVREFWLKATNEGVPSNSKCPSCAQMLKEFTAGEYNRAARLDLCKACQLIWFDRNELEMFLGAEKERHREIRRDVPIPRVAFEAPFDDEPRPAENIAGLCVHALCVVIRLLVFRS